MNEFDKNKNLPRSAIIVWRIRITLIMFAVVFLCGAVAVFDKKISAFLIFINFLFYLYIFIFYCEDRYKSQSYFNDDKFLQLKKGVYLKKLITIFKDKVQYTKLVIYPDQRLFGLCTLYIFLPGEKLSISQIELKIALLIEKDLNLEE